jgi:glutamine synthetase
MASLDAYDHYGKHLFTGKVADEYLRRHGASGDLLKNPSWVKTDADTVAKAVFDW